MMTASLILAGISVGLLVIYGIDVAVIQGGGDGFLPFDHMVRGIGLGGTSAILPFIAFFISRKEPSRTLGVLLVISGILIMVGGMVSLTVEPEPASDDAESGARNPVMEAAPLLAIGAVIIGLGVIKLRQTAG